METRLLARLLATARTVTALGAVAATRAVADENSEPVRAQVGARLPDGTFRVLIDGRAPLKLALPADVEPGDVIELKVVQRNGSVHASVMDEHRAQSGALSSPGRLISALLSEQPAPQPQARPILTLPPQAPSELPAPLARAVEASGLFYESHQARWVEGDYPLERLLQEPQAQLGAGAQAGRDPEPARAAAHPPLAVSAALDAAFDADGPMMEASSSSAPTTTAQPKDDAQQLVAREALPLVRNQLDALESRHITWLGEIWPGQPLRWEIEADDAGHGDDSDREPDGERGWSTRFSLELPQLGQVGADMTIGAGGIRVNLQARAPQVAELMRSCAHELIESLAAAGVSLLDVQVRCDESATGEGPLR